MKPRVRIVLGVVAWLLPALLPAQNSKVVLTNNDIVQMVNAGLPESLVIGSISASDINFDVSPSGLVALRKASVSEPIIEAMLSAQAKKHDAALASPPPSTHVSAPRNGAMGVPIMNSPAAEAPVQLPQVTLLLGDQRLQLEPSSTEIAQSRGRGGSKAGSVFKGVGKGMLMASNMAGVPPVSGGGRGGNPRMPGVAYTWALPGRNASLVLPSHTATFEIEFGDIPGIDPDIYEPTLVRLIPTKDNWRLVETSKEKFDKYGNDTRSTKTEDKTEVKIVTLGRGHLLVSPASDLVAGEYGLLLHPRKAQKEFAGVPTPNADAVFLSVWDFSVKQ